MKRLIKEIKLVMFEDEANGEYGLTHHNTQNDYEGFNAFWNGIGIFHDIFEHAHEYENKYFKGEYAMNIGGEMCAMGHMWYYQNTLGLHSKRNFGGNIGYYTNADNMRRTTEDMINECITSGYTNFGSELLSNVPNQSPLKDDWELEEQIKKYWSNIKNLYFKKDNSYDTEQEEASSKYYKKSLSFNKIANLHRYGYRQAEKLVPQTFHNRNMMCDFIDYWNNFCKSNDAKELYDLAYRNFIFKLYKDGDNITWTCFVKNQYPSEMKSVLLKETTKFYLEDNYVYDEQY